MASPGAKKPVDEPRSLLVYRKAFLPHRIAKNSGEMCFKMIVLPSQGTERELEYFHYLLPLYCSYFHALRVSGPSHPMQLLL